MNEHKHIANLVGVCLRCGLRLDAPVSGVLYERVVPDESKRRDKRGRFMKLWPKK